MLMTYTPNYETNRKNDTCTSVFLRGYVLEIVTLRILHRSWWLCFVSVWKLEWRTL